MSKEPKGTIEVQLRNDWYTGSRLLRIADNPHTLPEKALEALPSSAKVKVDEDFVPVDQLRKLAEEPAKPDASQKKDLKL